MHASLSIVGAVLTVIGTLAIVAGFICTLAAGYSDNWYTARDVAHRGRQIMLGGFVALLAGIALVRR